MAPQPQQQSVTPEVFVNELLRHAMLTKASDIHIEPMDHEFRIRIRVDGVLREILRQPLVNLDPVVNRLKVMASLDFTEHVTPQDGRLEVTLAVPIPAPATGTASPASTPAGATITQPAPVPTTWAESASKTSRGLFSGLFRQSGNSPFSPIPPPLPQTAGPTAPGAPTPVSVQPAAPIAAPEQKTINVRLSFFPTINGPAIVMRILDREDLVRSLDDFEMDPETLQRYKNLIGRAYGMVLITGPSGSGKTTTLYTTLTELKSSEKNILTLEDPVEFHFAEFRQSQIQSEQSFTFPIAMRSILRQDPDVLMIGEIRDPETAEYAMRAALIGRLVLSTLHSNTTIGTIARLLDMNIERSVIAYALNGIMARRLVRRMCHACQVGYDPAPEFLLRFKIQPGSVQFRKGKGCEACSNSGFLGRIGLFEVLEIDSGFKSLIIERAPMAELEKYMQAMKIRTLDQDGIQKVFAGLTTIEEVAKVV